MPLVMYRLIFMLFYLVLNFFHDDNRLANNRNRYLCHFDPIIHGHSLLLLVDVVHR
uniref:Uncharacterized protein n=1 Tax=Staphylococcus aureus TaxID=1280 RepID=M1XIJ2_STAAU|nr:hypothetical protein [Staphylococcus aureus]CCP89462.1 hypothetical protein [Staphylococcus aureus]CCP90012.1 hypothetical protein [Staphylococcus aureus]